MISILIYLIFVPILGSILLLVNFILAPHRPYKEKETPFECGYHSFLYQNRQEFTIVFFTTAMLFSILDMEILSILPSAVSFEFIGWFGMSAVIAFIVILGVGFVYELGKGAIDITTRQDKILIQNTLSFNKNYCKQFIKLFITIVIVICSLWLIKELYLYTGMDLSYVYYILDNKFMCLLINNVSRTILYIIYLVPLIKLLNILSFEILEYFSRGERILYEAYLNFHKYIFNLKNTVMIRIPLLFVSILLYTIFISFPPINEASDALLNIFNYVTGKSYAMESHGDLLPYNFMTGNGDNASVYSDYSDDVKEAAQISGKDVEDVHAEKVSGVPADELSEKSTPLDDNYHKKAEAEREGRASGRKAFWDKNNEDAAEHVSWFRGEQYKAHARKAAQEEFDELLELHPDGPSPPKKKKRL